MSIGSFWLALQPFFYKDKGQGFIVIAVCKGTKLNNVSQKTKHIYLCPVVFLVFASSALSGKRKDEQLFFIFKNYLQKKLYSQYLFIFLPCCCLFAAFLQCLGKRILRQDKN